MGTSLCSGGLNPQTGARRELAFVSFNSSIDWVAYLIGMVITLSVFLLGAIPVALQKYMNSRKREEEFQQHFVFNKPL